MHTRTIHPPHTPGAPSSRRASSSLRWVPLREASRGAKGHDFSRVAHSSETRQRTGAPFMRRLHRAWVGSALPKAGAKAQPKRPNCLPPPRHKPHPKPTNLPSHPRHQTLHPRQHPHKLPRHPMPSGQPRRRVVLHHHKSIRPTESISAIHPSRLLPHQNLQRQIQRTRRRSQHHRSPRLRTPKHQQLRLRHRQPHLRRLAAMVNHRKQVIPLAANTPRSRSTVSAIENRLRTRTIPAAARSAIVPPFVAGAPRTRRLHRARVVPALLNSEVKAQPVMTRLPSSTPPQT